MASKKIELKHPVSYEDTEYSELEFVERIKMKHLKKVPVNVSEKIASGEMNFEGLIPLIAALTEVPVGVIEEIDIEDIPAVSEGVSDFF